MCVCVNKSKDLSIKFQKILFTFFNESVLNCIRTQYIIRSNAGLSCIDALAPGQPPGSHADVGIIRYNRWTEKKVVKNAVYTCTYIPCGSAQNNIRPSVNFQPYYQNDLAKQLIVGHNNLTIGFQGYTCTVTLVSILLHVKFLPCTVKN